MFGLPVFATINLLSIAFVGKSFLKSLELRRVQSALLKRTQVYQHAEKNQSSEHRNRNGDDEDK